MNMCGHLHIKMSVHRSIRSKKGELRDCFHTLYHNVSTAQNENTTLLNFLIVSNPLNYPMRLLCFIFESEHLRKKIKRQ